MLFLLIPFCFFQTTISSASEPIVTISDGNLRGSVLKDIDGKHFFSFQSIPFAKPPIGELRFKDPQPVEKWSGTLDATIESPICLQKVFVLNTFAGTENCLYLNVYTPKLKPKKLKPVLVFIHGGGFTEGTGNYSTYGPEFLMTQDIVLVTINYRLGILGFTHFNNPNVNVTGNAGLKDQTMALKWVRRNIRNFGGDPQKVTISGESAGAASVHLHVLSPLSQGLFQRAILQSGTALSPWCNGQRNNGVASAKFLGFDGDDEEEMLKFLQNVTDHQLEKASLNATMLIPIHIPNQFGPTIEDNSPTAFLSKAPRDIIKFGNFNTSVHLMVGITSAEGIIFDALHVLRDNATYKPWPTERNIPFQLNLNDYQIQDLTHKIDYFYGNNESYHNLSHIAIQTDSYFTYPLYETIFGHLKHAQNMLVYLFSSDSKMNVIKRSNNITYNFEGCSHLDDLTYLFKYDINAHTYSIENDSIEYKSIKNTVKLFGDFVKKGNVKINETQHWNVAKRNNITYLDINLDKNQFDVDLFRNRASFWCDIYREYKQEQFCSDNWTLL
nr:esterase B1-like [Onthophagus taurus]